MHVTYVCVYVYIHTYIYNIILTCMHTTCIHVYRASWPRRRHEINRCSVMCTACRKRSRERHPAQMRAFRRLLQVKNFDLRLLKSVVIIADFIYTCFVISDLVFLSFIVRCSAETPVLSRLICDIAHKLIVKCGYADATRPKYIREWSMAVHRQIHIMT
jgi:hypothetical protein